MGSTSRLSLKARIGILCLMGTSLIPANALAQVEEERAFNYEGDTLELSSTPQVKTEDGYKPALPKSAFEYMLQKPRVSKRFDHKKFGDHLFLEMGVGINTVAVRVDNIKIGPQVEVKIGDWITPEHGWRLGGKLGAYYTHQYQAKFFQISPDYIMNLTALANRNYPKYKRFELYGFAGFDIAYSQDRADQTSEQAKRHQLGKSLDKINWGVHLGFHGQYELTRNTYAYIEPTLMLLEDDMTKAYTHYNFRPAGSITVGFGYRVSEAMRLRQHTREYRAEKALELQDLGYHTVGGKQKFADGLFFSVAGGYSFLANSHPSQWPENDGGRFAVHMGKWFTPYQGLRLGVNYTNLQQTWLETSATHRRISNVGIQADYMLNLHNMFIGLNPNRYWWINYLLGGSVNFSNQSKTTFGIGTGLQGNVRIAPAVTFFVEPRLDFYQKDYAIDGHSLKNVDLVGSVLAGFTYTYNAGFLKRLKASRDQFESTTWHDHIFVEGGFGYNYPIIDNAKGNFKEYTRTLAFIGVGKWFNALHGARFWMQISKAKYEPETYSRHAEMGLDYMFNFTNAFLGYNENRKFEVTGGAGVNVSVLKNENHLNFGAQAFLRGTYYPSRMLGIFIEPRLTGYGKHYFPIENEKKVTLLASGHVGLQFNMMNYNKSAETAKFEQDGGRHGSFYAAGGFCTPAYMIKHGEAYAGIIRAGYTNWFTPLSAWRVSLQGIAARHYGGQKNRYRKYAEGKAGIDYLYDITAHTYGYDPDRVVSVYGVLGANIGFDYSDSKTYANGDFHAGGQLAFLIAKNTHLFTEAEIAYRMTKRFNGMRNQRYLPQLLFGIDYGMQRQGKISSVERDEKKHFATVSVGTGMSSLTFGHAHPYRRRLSAYAEVAYGSWLTGVHGWQVGVANTTLKDFKVEDWGTVMNTVTVDLAYVMNVRAALSGVSTEYKKLQVTGIAGPTLNINFRKNRDTGIAPGFKLAFQAAYRVNSSLDLYVQPGGNMYSRKLIPGGTEHTFDGDLNITLGTKFRF